jgi:type I restriction enzyme S subunit
MKKGWPVTRLGDLADLVTKGTTPTSIGHAFVPEGINFVKVESITITGEFIIEKLAHITPECHEVLGRSQLKDGDILFSIAGALGRTAFVTADILPANTNQALAIVRLKPDAKVLPKFVLKALETGVVLEQIEKFKGGVAQQNLSLAQVRDFHIALPPLAEQQRIVGVLDEAFAGLATAQAHAAQNLQNARALFESHLQSVFTHRGKGWVEKTLGELCQIKTGKKDVNQGNPEGQYPFFTCAAEHTYSDVYSFDTEALLVAGNGNVGQVSYYSGKFEAYQRTYVLFDFKGVTAKYLFRVLDKRLSATVGKQKLGNTMPYIKIGMLTDFPVPIPPGDEQARVTAHLDALAAETQRLTRLYEQKQAALAALKKSLLHQAFTGNL